MTESIDELATIVIDHDLLPLHAAHTGLDRRPVPFALDHLGSEDAGVIAGGAGFESLSCLNRCVLHVATMPHPT